MLPLLLTLLLSGPVAQAPPEYRVGPGDVLQIEFLDLSDYTRSSTVQPNGTIALKGLKSPVVKGLSVLQIQELVRKLYVDASVLIDPAVSVTVTEYRSQKVFVQGEVRAPGDQTLKGFDLTLLRALNGAQGFTPKSGQKIEIKRKMPNGTVETLPPFNRKELESGTIVDPALQDGDVIIVSTAPIFFINGQINSPGEKIWEANITVEKAIAMAGGVTASGSKDRVEIRRLVNGKREQVNDVKRETLILPDDIVEVKKKIIGQANRP